MKKLLFIGLFIVVLIISITFIQQKQINAISFENYTHLEDGVYDGTYKTTLVSAKVEVTLVNQKIEDIKLLEHTHYQGEEAENILQTIIENNSHQVDAISGATHSSQVIKKAVENALSKARKDS